MSFDIKKDILHTCSLSYFRLNVSHIRYSTTRNAFTLS